MADVNDDAVNGELSGGDVVDASADDLEAPGSAIVRADAVGTALALVAGVLAVVSADLAKFLLVPVVAVLGVVGLVTFVWSYFRAVGRSRESEISVSQLYAVAGSVAPPAVKRRLQWSLWAQVILAIAVMFIGFQRTKPEEFNWAATIIVLPLFGMGLNGVWVSLHGSFGPRIIVSAVGRKRRSTRSKGASTPPK